MPVDFYDNCHFVLEDDPPLIQIERVYRFDTGSFTEGHWQTLGEIYEQLPQYQWVEDGPYWFGTDEREIPYLYVSYEPPGLVAVGELLLEQWKKWDSLFQEATLTFPFRPAK